MVSNTAVEQNQMFELRLTLRPRGRDVNLTASVVGVDGTTRISSSFCPSNLGATRPKILRWIAPTFYPRPQNPEFVNQSDIHETM